MTLARIATAALVAAAALPAPAEGIGDLGWLAGSWIQRKNGAETEEHWLAPKGGMLVGVNRTVTPGQPTGFELLRIENRDGRLAYLATPGGRTPVAFMSVEQSKMRIVFENPAHEFPRRIAYWREGDVLICQVEGLIQGQRRGIQWRFQRMN